MSESLVGVVKAAAELRRSSQVQWEEFVKSMQNHAARTLLDVIAADKDHLSQAQGRAQALAELLKKLEDCQMLDEQYRRR
jgi:hypothetical protein